MKYNPSIPGFTIQLGNNSHTFHRQPFAPPSGQSTYNYSRYIHKETNATRYMMLWYTNRITETNCPLLSGGNFYLADYGVRVQSAIDTSICWEPEMQHGTSLMERGEGFEQIGMSIGIGKRLGGIWAKHVLEEYENDNMVQDIKKEFENPIPDYEEL